ncbi:uncharacterized protein LOC144285362 [Canis aureus]
MDANPYSTFKAISQPFRGRSILTGHFHPGGEEEIANSCFLEFKPAYLLQIWVRLLCKHTVQGPKNASPTSITACSGTHKDQPSLPSLLECACHPRQLTRVHAPPEEMLTCSLPAEAEASGTSLAPGTQSLPVRDSAGLLPLLHSDDNRHRVFCKKKSKLTANHGGKVLESGLRTSKRYSKVLKRFSGIS